MKIAYIGNNLSDGENFKNAVEKIEGVGSCLYFDDCQEMVQHINLNRTDIVFVHINTKCENIKELFEKVKQINKATEVVFVTDCKESKIKAFEMDALGYIVSPFSEACLKNLIYKTQKLHKTEKQKPIIRTFGNFDIFINDRAVMFSNKKSKELLALLVDKCGGSLNMEQIIDVLWEDRPFDENTKALYRIALKNLRDTLKKAGCIDMLIEKRGQRSIDVNKVSCDFYELINGEKTIFSGEYMTNYSWGEYTLAKLYEKYC